MEAEPGVRLPLYSFKNKFLTPDRKPDTTFFHKVTILFKAINMEKTFCRERYVIHCTPSVTQVLSPLP